MGLDLSLDRAGNWLAIIEGDKVREPDERFTVVAGPPNVKSATATHAGKKTPIVARGVGTIVDND